VGRPLGAIVEYVLNLNDSHNCNATMYDVKIMYKILMINIIDKKQVNR